MPAPPSATSWAPPTNTCSRADGPSSWPARRSRRLASRCRRLPGVALVRCDHDGRVPAQLGCDVLARHRVPNRPADGDRTGERDHRHRGSRTRSAATSFGTGSTDQKPSSRSDSARISPSTSADNGVAGAGSRRMGAPTATAGAPLCPTRFSGTLNGAMPRTGPRGARRTSAIRPVAVGSVSNRCSVPDHRRASAAPQRKVRASPGEIVARSVRCHGVYGVLPDLEFDGAGRTVQPASSGA